jgi:hypothetical protein
LSFDGSRELRCSPYKALLIYSIIEGAKEKNIAEGRSLQPIHKRKLNDFYSDYLLSLLTAASINVGGKSHENRKQLRDGQQKSIKSAVNWRATPLAMES